jgi:hypothetical protein
VVIIIVVIVAMAIVTVIFALLFLQPSNHFFLLFLHPSDSFRPFPRAVLPVKGLAMNSGCASAL